MMKINKLLLVPLCGILLTACNDDLGVKRGGNGPYYFNVTEHNAWSESQIGTRSTPEIPMELQSDVEGQTLYLIPEAYQTTTLNQKEQPETRGARIMGEVFEPVAGKLTTFGIYGKAGSSIIFSDFTEITRGTELENDWYVKETEFPLGIWDDADKGNFYAYAPYFAASSGLSASLEDGVPTLSYVAPTNVADQIDVLTSKHLNVSHGSDIELPFDHVLSAIMFRIKPNESNNFIWKSGTDEYNVTISGVQLNNVLYKGTWEIGEDIATKTWDALGDKQSFSISPDVDLEGKTTTTALNADATNDVFMMLPQTTPGDASVKITCTMTKTDDSSVQRTVTFSASLAEKTWKPGYTYIYNLSMTDLRYVFDFNDEKLITKNDIDYNGTDYTNIVVRSYKVDSHDNYTDVNWKVQYPEDIASVTGVGSGDDETQWKDGTPEWIELWDNNGESGTVQVTGAHEGAHVNTDTQDWYYKLSVKGIKVPVIDLSIYDQYQAKRWKRSTSNCYIVSGPGTYLIPLIYGNAWTNGHENQDAYKINHDISKISSRETREHILQTFLRYDDQPITNTLINQDVTAVNGGVLVWEEGDGVTASLRTSDGGSSGGNNGTIIKVQSALVTSDTDEEGNKVTGTNDFKSKAKYLKFTIEPSGFKYGNAVVGVTDGTDIVWSWHIWMVNPDWFIKNNETLTIEGHTATYATTNIGWISQKDKDGNDITVSPQNRSGKIRLVQDETGEIIEIDVNQKKFDQFTPYNTNVLYQWGRKDPMRGNVDKAQNNSNDGAPRGAAGVKPWSNPFGVSGTQKSIGDMIKEPNTIYGKSRGDLYTTSYYNLWAMNIKKKYTTNGGTWSSFGKTIYDPSPVGYCVPPSKFFTHLTRGNFEEKNAGESEPFTCKYNTTNLVFHCAGVRTSDLLRGNKSRGCGVATGMPGNGFFHTATPYSKDECWQLRLYFYQSGLDTHNFIRGDHEQALAVKPILWNGEIVEESEPDVDQEKEYLTFTFQEDGELYWVADDSRTPTKTITVITKDGTSNQVSATGDGTKIATVQAGDVVKVYGTNTTYCTHDSYGYHYNHFNSTADYELSGNIMSLIWGKDDFYANRKVFNGGTFNFCSLFYNQSKLLSVDNLAMPAETLTESCYESMFQDCHQISSTPLLPATSGATNCYKKMFYRTISLDPYRSELSAVYVKLNPGGSDNYTDDWLTRVAEDGVFYYDKTTPANWPSNTEVMGAVTNGKGIPKGWDTDYYPGTEPATP